MEFATKTLAARFVFFVFFCFRNVLNSNLGKVKGKIDVDHY